MADFWSDLGDALAAAAPTAASLIGGPLAGQAVTLVENALGLAPTPGASETERVQAATAAMAQATPQQLVDLKKLDNELQIALATAATQRMGIEAADRVDQRATSTREQEIASGDRANARQRESLLRDHAPFFVSIFIITGFFGVLFWLMKYGLPSSGSEVFITTDGALTLAFGAAVNYFLGSSAGSANKDQLMGRMAPAPAPTGSVTVSNVQTK